MEVRPEATQLGTDDIRRSWPRILGRVSAARRYLWMILNQYATVTELSSGSPDQAYALWLTFKDPGSRDNFNQSGGEEMVAQAVQAELGVTVAVRARLESEPIPPQGRTAILSLAKPASTPPPPPPAHPLVPVRADADPLPGVPTPQSAKPPAAPAAPTQHRGPNSESSASPRTTESAGTLGPGPVGTGPVGTAPIGPDPGRYGAGVGGEDPADSQAGPAPQPPDESPGTVPTDSSVVPAAQPAGPAPQYPPSDSLESSGSPHRTTESAGESAGTVPTDSDAEPAGTPSRHAAPPRVGTEESAPSGEPPVPDPTPMASSQQEPSPAARLTDQQEPSPAARAAAPVPEPTPRTRKPAAKPAPPPLLDDEPDPEDDAIIEAPDDQAQELVMELFDAELVKEEQTQPRPRTRKKA